MPKRKSQPQNKRSLLARQAWIMASGGSPVSEIAKCLGVSIKEARKLRAEAGEEIRAQGLKVIRERKTKQGDPMPGDFVDWLQNIATPRLAQMSEWPMGITQYTYFDSEAVWDYRVLATINVDSINEYRKKHESGDRDAIFSFAKSTRMALSKKWVVKQLVHWRLSGTKDGKRLFDKFMRAYWSQQGRRTLENMLEIIAKDQMVYRDSLSLITKNRVTGIAKKHGVGTNHVKDILKFYKAAYLKWKASRLTRLWWTTSSSLPR